jgi:hypothetical protein
MWFSRRRYATWFQFSPNYFISPVPSSSVHWEECHSHSIETWCATWVSF